MGSLVIFLLLFVGIALLIAGAQSLSSQSSRSPNKLRLIQKPQAKPSPSMKPETILERHARYRDPSDGMQERLIELMQGDRDAAERLVSRMRFAKPGKSESYYWWLAVQEMDQQTDSADLEE